MHDALDIIFLNVVFWGSLTVAGKAAEYYIWKLMIDYVEKNYGNSFDR